VLQFEPHVDDLGLHSLQTRERARPQRVFRNERAVRIVSHLQRIVAGVKDVDGRATGAPIHVTAAQRLHFIAQLRPRPASFG